MCANGTEQYRQYKIYITNSNQLLERVLKLKPWSDFLFVLLLHLKEFLMIDDPL